MLVVNEDGVFQIQTDGTVSQLVAGPVAYAVDDTQGGLLFQVEGGRDWEDFFSDPTPGRSTVVWWVPRGDSVPRELLAPTPAAGHALSLHDAFATDESFAVVYLRHEGEEPPFNGNMADTLRVYDAATRTVTQLYSVRGYEWNLVDVSAGDGLVSATEVQTGGHGCRLFDGSGNAVTRPGVPTATPTCFEESGNCPASCALSVDAARVAYDWLKRGQDDAVDWEIVVAEVDTGAEEARFVVPVIGRWGPAELDIHDDLVLLNRAWEGLYEEPALLADMSDPTSAPTALPIAGRARFVTQAINIAAPVTAPGPKPAGPDYYRYGEDGLFRVVDGTETQLVDGPVVHVWDDHMGGTIIADVTASDVLHLRAGETTPTLIARVSGYAYARFTGIIDGHPSLFFAGIPEGAELDQWPCDDWSLNSRDLLTGEERRHLCLPIEDAGFDIRSTGGERFAGAPYGQCGGTFTSSSIRFWNLTGNPVDVPANPHPQTESCAPCELDALISPDGTHLAYRHRPDSFHPDSPHYSGPGCGGGAEQFEAWWDGSKDVPAEIVVIDIDNGEMPWRMEVSADSHMSDFDGRSVVVSRKGESVIYDTWEERPPVRVPGNVTLIRPLASLDR